ncbi:MAG: alpha/beta fold hydrolase [Calditrichaeota bacterium]|nr:alpha/beta fold hydrolase [Calditrichota bacterium]
MTVIDSKDISWNLEISGTASAPPLVLLHGFAQSIRGFELLLPSLEKSFRVLRVDLPGHGRTLLNDESSLDWETLCASLVVAIEKAEPRPAHWFGYSQGGRVALMCALSKPELVTSLTLLGASTGIPDPTERAKRVESDNLLGENIVRRGMEWFTEFWESLPIFVTQKQLPSDVQEFIRKERLSCTPEGLRLALHCYGTGTMPDRFAELAACSKPLMLAAGELDTKFVESNEKLAGVSEATYLQNHVLTGSGHAAHLEQPELFAKLLREFVDKVEGFIE